MVQDVGLRPPMPPPDAEEHASLPPLLPGPESLPKNNSPPSLLGGLAVKLQVYALEKRNQIAAEWEIMSPRRRFAYGMASALGSAAGMAVVLRFGSMAAGPIEDGLMGLAHHAPLEALQAHGTQPNMTLAGSSHTTVAETSVLTGSIVPPADPNSSPESEPLEPLGTVWGQVEDYTNSLGYDFGSLTPPQQMAVVGVNLTHTGTSWPDAHYLLPSYEPQLSTRAEMEQFFQNNGVPRTHQPTVPEETYPNGGNQANPGGTQTPSPAIPRTPGMPKEAYDGISRTLIGAGVAIAGVLGVVGLGYAGGKYAQRRAAEDERRVGITDTTDLGPIEPKEDVTGLPPPSVIKDPKPATYDSSHVAEDAPHEESPHGKLRELDEFPGEDVSGRPVSGGAPAASEPLVPPPEHKRSNDAKEDNVKASKEEGKRKKKRPFLPLSLSQLIDSIRERARDRGKHLLRRR